MGIILDTDRRPCDQCGRAMKQTDQFHGPNMWHRHVWCCRHTVTVECPDCFRSCRAAKCPECGLSDEYT